jgi:integrase
VPRARTGTLILKAAGYFARVRVSVNADDGTPLRGEDGKPKRERRWFDLDTKDAMLARRKLAKLIKLLDEGRVEAVAREAIQRPVTCAEYRTETFIPRRKILGIRMVPEEEINLTKHIMPLLGPITVPDVKRNHIREILDAAAMKGLGKGTVGHIRRLLVRFFNAAIDDGIIDVNPCNGVKVPPMKDDLRQRVILTDEEIWEFLDSKHERVSFEMKMLAAVARTEGGARTVELNRWDWSSIDRLHFAGCVLPRGKGGAPQALEVPEVLRPALGEWWKRQDCPAAGPVFPVRRGKRRGGFKEVRGSSYAGALRHMLLLAGVRRHACTRPQGADPVKRDEACCSNMNGDPLFRPTPTSKPVDFHSFRRAFVTALATAGVNEQHAMRVTGHTDSRTHRKYTMDTAAMRAIPVAAVPRLPALSQWTPPGDQSSRSTENHRGRELLAATGSDDAYPGNSGVEYISAVSSEAKGPAFESRVARRATALRESPSCRNGRSRAQYFSTTWRAPRSSVTKVGPSGNAVGPNYGLERTG